MTTSRTESHARASVALKAAKNRTQWGMYATIRYVIRMKCPLNLYFLASRLEAIKNLKVEACRVETIKNLKVGI